MKTAFIASGTPVGMSKQYRSIHLQEQLAINHIRATVKDWNHFDDTLVNQANQAEIVIFQRVDMSESVHRVIDYAHELGRPVIFDADDLVFDPELSHWNRVVSQFTEEQKRLYDQGVNGYLHTLLACDYALMSSKLLVEQARKRGVTTFFHRNAVGEEMQRIGDSYYRKRHERLQQVTHDKVLIGYGSGTATHNVDFQEVIPALVTLFERYPNINLCLVGPLELPSELDRFSERILRFPLTDLTGWFEIASSFDINLAPLEMGNLFCRAKSEIKFVEAGLLGIPTVASRIDPFEQSIIDHHDGILAATQSDWIVALESLITQPDLRDKIGKAAKETVATRYSLATRALELSAILKTIQQDRRKARRKRPLELARVGKKAINVLKASGLSGLTTEVKNYVQWQLMKFR